MKIEIRKLTPELSCDYFDFFENRAFTDDSPYRCYCQMYQMSKEQVKESSDYAKANGLDGGQISKKVAGQQIESGILRGYLAFAGGAAIGWCNANDRANYPDDPHEDVPFHSPVKNREKAVVCFEIAPEYRGKGVATALLERVIADASAEGYEAVVAFPVIRNEHYEWDFNGPVRLYEKAGFVKTTQHDRCVMMKKDLTEAAD